MTGLPLARYRLLAPLLHPGGEYTGSDHLDERGSGVADIEEVALPSPLKVAGVLEPAATQAGDLVVAPVRPGGVGDLLPETEHPALHVVDEDPLIGIGPPAEPLHPQHHQIGRGP